MIQKNNVHVEKECELMALGPWFGGLRKKDEPNFGCLVIMILATFKELAGRRCGGAVHHTSPRV